MATISTLTAPILALQTPLLNLAYSLTGDRNDAYDLLRDTTRRAMSAPGVFSTRESLFAVMHTIFDSVYSGRATRRRSEAAARAYSLPRHATLTTDSEVNVPEGTVTVDRAEEALASIRDERHHRAMTLRATGYRYRDIAREAGISVFRARLRVVLAAISLRAILA